MSSSSRFSDGRLGAPPPGPVWVPQGLTPGVRTLNEPTISLQRVHTPDPVPQTAAASAPASMRPEPKVPAVVKLASPVPASVSDLPVSAPPAERVSEAATKPNASAIRAHSLDAVVVKHEPAPVATAAAEPDTRAWVEPEWAAPVANAAAPATPETWQAPVATEAPTLAVAASQSAANTNLVADVRRRLQSAPQPAVARPAEMRPVARFRALLSRSAEHSPVAPSYEPAQATEQWPDPGVPYAAGYGDTAAMPADEAWSAPAPDQYWNVQHAAEQSWHGAAPQTQHHAPEAGYAQSWPGTETGYADADGTTAGGFPHDAANDGWIEANAGALDGVNGAPIQHHAATAAGRFAQALTARGGAWPWVAGCVVLAAIGAVGLGVWLSGKPDVPAQRIVAIAPAPAVVPGLLSVQAPVTSPAAVAPAPAATVSVVTPGPILESAAPVVPALVLPDRPFEAVVTCPGMAAGKPITVLGPDTETVRSGLAQSLPSCTLDRLTAMGPAPSPAAEKAGRTDAETMP